MIPLGELRVQAVMDNLRTITSFVQGIAYRLNLSEKSQFEVELAVEEAATNIIRHAYAAGPAGDLSLRAQADDERLSITLTDWGLPLDPSQVKPYDVNAPLEARTEGGMGLHLIHNLMDEVKRETAPLPGGPNALTLVKRIERLPPGAHRPSTLRELQAIRTVSQIMVTGIELDELLELIVHKLVETIDAERGTLYLVDEARGELVSRVLMDQGGEIRVKLGEGLSGYVAATGETLNVRDAYQDPRFLPTFDRLTGYRVHTVLTAPMRNPQGKIIGVVQLMNKRGGPFTSRDERLLAAMAAQAAISIENARLYQQELDQRLMERELEMARAIQQSFLPQQVPQPEGWDIAAFWQPMRKVAGDFYDFYPLPDGRLALVIADVSGKGVPAALFMALSRTVLRFAMSLNFPPDQLLDQANQVILTDQQSRMFATVFVGYLDLAAGVMRFASAGHLPPLFYQAATGQCRRLKTPGAAIGVFRDVRYGAETVTFAPGDVLVLYTDGITEATDEQYAEFGLERLETLVGRQAGCPAHTLVQRIIAAVDDWTATDDKTLVVVRRV